MWSLCGATYPIRHVAVQHNNPTANVGIWWVCLNRAGNMLRCNITLTPMWVFGAVQHGGRAMRVRGRGYLTPLLVGLLRKPAPPPFHNVKIQ